MSIIEDVVAATNGLVIPLNDQMATYSETIADVHATVQRYQTDWWPGISEDDEHIDLYDFAAELMSRVVDPSIRAAADEVMGSVEDLVVAEAHRSGRHLLWNWNWDGSHGLSIFFPSERRSCYDSDYCDFCGGTWTGALSFESDGEPPHVMWGPMLVSYFDAVDAGGPDNPVTPDLMERLVPTWDLFLPFVMR